MKDLLADFLKQGTAALDQAPYDFMKVSPPSGCIDGLQAALFLDWASGRSLLDSSIQSALADFDESWADRPDERAEAIRSLLQGSLRPEHFSDRGRAFSNLYYRPGWKHGYLADLERLFPEVTEFSLIKPSATNIERVNALLDARLSEFEQGGGK